MKILFDQGVPVPLRAYLKGYIVKTAYEEGWSVFANGDLLNSAEKAGYDVFITTGQNLSYQQNLKVRKISIVVLLSTSWPKIRRCVDGILQVLENLKPNAYEEIGIN